MANLLNFWGFHFFVGKISSNGLAFSGSFRTAKGSFNVQGLGFPGSPEPMLHLGRCDENAVRGDCKVPIDFVGDHWCDSLMKHGFFGCPEKKGSEK